MNHYIKHISLRSKVAYHLHNLNKNKKTHNSLKNSFKACSISNNKLLISKQDPFTFIVLQKLSRRGKRKRSNVSHEQTISSLTNGSKTTRLEPIQKQVLPAFNQSRKSNPNLFNPGCSRSDSNTHAISEHSDDQRNTLNKQNAAQLSARLQYVEYNNRYRQNHTLANETLKDLSGINKPRTDSHYLQTGTEMTQYEESPLKALLLAQVKPTEKRRQSLFGNKQIKTTDPLQKLLQTKKYLVSDEQKSRQQEIKSSFKNEVLSKTLSQTYKASEYDEAHNFIPQSSNSRNANDQNNLYSARLWQGPKPNATTHNERFYLQKMNQSKSIERGSDSMMGGGVGGHNQSSNTLLNNENLALVIPEMIKKKDIRINDAVQQALAVQYLNEYNRDCKDYNSLLIHLGVMTKKAQIEAQNHMKPAYFITSVATHAFDKIALFFPQFSKVLISLKHMLLSSIYYQYDEDYHIQEDKIEMEQQNMEPDLTRRNPKIQIKYLRYETFHDKLAQLAKQNRNIIKEKELMNQSRYQDKRQSRVLKNVLNYFQAFKQVIITIHEDTKTLYRNKSRLRRLFDAFRVQNYSDDQKVLNQYMTDKIIGKDSRRKEIMKKYLLAWQFYMKDIKMKKSNKQTEFYRNKIDELEKQVANLKMQVMDSSLENQKYKEFVKDLRKKNTLQEQQLGKFKDESNNRKPNQIRQCLKIYFKYIFTNPLVSRLEVQKPNTITSSNQDDEKDNPSSKINAIFFQHLLQKKETIEDGGIGIQTLYTLNMKDLMIRWANYMVDLAILKLDPIIRLLERHVKLSGEEEYQTTNNKNKFVFENQSNQSIDIHVFEFDKNDMQQVVPFDEGQIYEPFQNYAQDLYYLQRIKKTIQKYITNLQTNMILDGSLMGVLFALDHTKRVIHVQVKDQQHNPGSQKKKDAGESMYQLMLRNANDIEEDKEVPDYKKLLLYSHAQTQAEKSQQLIEYTEAVVNVKIKWFFQEIDFLRGTESFFTSFLSFLFYHNSCLDREYNQDSLPEQKQKDESKLSNQLYKKLFHSLRQKLNPLLQRKQFSNLQDVTLLYSPQEIKEKLVRDQKTHLNLLMELPYMQVPDILLRWVNFLLRSYSEQKLLYELENKFKMKFIQSKQNSMSKLQRAKNNTSDNLSFSPIRPGGQAMSELEGLTRTNAAQYGGKLRVGKDSQTFTSLILRNVNDQSDLGFEITSLDQLAKDHYARLIMILIYLSPESLWENCDLDFKEIKKLPHIVESADAFIEKGTLDQKYLFIINAVIRITNKNVQAFQSNSFTLQYLISLDDLYQKSSHHYLDLVTELYFARSCLYGSKNSSNYTQKLQLVENFYKEQKDYLKQFDQSQYEILHNHIVKMRDQKQDMIEAFAFIQDCERIYTILKEKLMLAQHDYAEPHKVLALQMRINSRSMSSLCKIEQSITQVSRSQVHQLFGFKTTSFTHNWVNRIEEVLRKYLLPIRRYLNVYLDLEDGCMNYFDLWRALKSLNLRTFSIDSRELEFHIHKIIKLKEKEVNPFKQTETDTNSQSSDMRYQRSDLQYTFFDQGRVSSSKRRMRTKNPIVKEVEDATENLSQKAHFYRAKFTPADFILILMYIAFRQEFQSVLIEIRHVNSKLFEEVNKGINRLQAKERIQQQIEAYFQESRPEVLFQQFLLNCVLLKSDFIKKHPFRFNMMKEDFKSFLDNYLNSLYSVFEFYFNDYASMANNPGKYRNLCINIDAINGLLRDFNAFSSDSGLNKAGLKRILLVISMQEKSGDYRDPNNKGVIENHYASPSKISTSPQLKKNRSTSRIDKVSPNGTQNDYESLVFFEFIEMLYLVSIYQNPDPFINPNQKFADFLEKTVFLNIRFKMKSKSLVESPHKQKLIKSLQDNKSLRVSNLETFNNPFDLH